MPQPLTVGPLSHGVVVQINPDLESIITVPRKVALLQPVPPGFAQEKALDATTR